MRFETPKGDVNIDVKFVPGDMWIGIFWRNSYSVESTFSRFEIFLCVLPCVPIHLNWSRNYK